MTRKKTTIAALAVSAGLALSAVAAGPAFAGVATVGGHSCSVSVKLTANSTLNTHMYLNSGGQYKEDTKPGNSLASIKVLYSTFGATTAGGASTAGTIYSLANGCDY